MYSWLDRANWAPIVYSQSQTILHLKINFRLVSLAKLNRQLVCCIPRLSAYNRRHRPYGLDQADHLANAAVDLEQKPPLMDCTGAARCPIALLAIKQDDTHGAHMSPVRHSSHAASTLCLITLPPNLPPPHRGWSPN